MQARITACLALAGALVAGQVLSAEEDPGQMLDAGAAHEWRAVGRVNIGGLNTKGLCTGTLIRPDVVLTAAHCVVHQRTGKPHRLGSIYFVAGWYKGEMTGHGVAAALAVHPFYKPGEANQPHVLNADMALIRLDKPLSPEAAEPFAIGAPPPPGYPVTVVSYRKDRPHAPTLQDNCAFKAHEGPLIVLDCPVASGASGAPVLAEIDGEMRVIATLVAMDHEGHAFAVQAKGAVENLLDSLDNQASAGAGN